VAQVNQGLPEDEDEGEGEGEEAPRGTPTAPFRSDSAGHEGHMLDRHLKGLDPGPGAIFRNHRGVSSKRSVKDK
jgi:hypothetical protein